LQKDKESETVSKEDFTGIYSGQRQTLLAAGVWQTSGALICGFVAWILDLIVAREDIGLGAEGIGVLNIGTVVFLFATLVIVGLKKSTSQKISENILDNQLALKEARNGAFAILIISIVTGIALIISSFFVGNPLTFQNKMSSIIFIVGILMFLVFYRGGTHSVLSGIGDYDSIAKSRLIFFIFQLGSGLLLIVLILIYELPITLIFLAYAFGLIAQLLISFKYFKELQMFNPETFRFHFRGHQLARNVKEGTLFAISEIVPLNILGSASIIVLYIFTQDFAVSGAFSIVVGYSLAGLLITNFTWPLITHIAEAYGKQDSEKIGHNLKLVVKLFFYITSLVVVILLALSRGFIFVFYGSPYLTGAIDIWIPFMLMVVGSSIISFIYILCCVLLGVGKRKPAAIYLGALFLVIIGTCSLFLWLNPLGAYLSNAAQVTTALGFLVGSVIMVAFIPSLIRKEINQKVPFSIGLRSIFALLTTLGISIILFWPPLNLIIITNIFILIFCLILVGAIYLLLLVFYGAVSKEDIQLFREKINDYRRVRRIVGPILTFMEKLMDISPFYKDESPDDIE
jgi:O-antigen/teichoic acid export membrane protein